MLFQVGYGTIIKMTINNFPAKIKAMNNCFIFGFECI